MAEPALDINDYRYGNAAPETEKIPQQIEDEAQAKLKLVRKRPYSATFEQHDANIKYILFYLSLILVAATFLAGAAWTHYYDRQVRHDIKELQAVYNTQHEEMKRLTAVVEEKISASVITEYAETKLGMVKIPDSNKVYSDTGTQNGIITE